MDVYLDATLHPLLKQSDFVQEGWRVGPENPSSPSADKPLDDLVFKGVVYNEMKGQMSDVQYLYYIRFMEHIFPAINNSGGDPQKMTSLTYEQLKSFHRQHYHPSNSKIVTYGNQPVEDHLRMLGEQLDRFSEMKVDQDTKLPISLESGPRNITISGPVDPLTPVNAQSKTSVTWLVGDTTDIVESFAFRIATTILLDGYGSPMYRALIESGLGVDFSPNTRYDTSGSKGIFSIGLTGVTKENVPKVKEVVAATLIEVVARGFNQHKVHGLLHQLEVGLKHKSATFGLDIIQRLKPGWFNGIDPFDALAWNSIVDQFKTNYAQEGYLEDLLKQYLFTDNTMTFTMEPSNHFAADLVIEEAKRLENKIDHAVKNFPNEQDAYAHLKQRELDLVEEQEAGRTQSLDCLPTLHLSDISREQNRIETRDSTINGTSKVQWREAPTNGLSYFRALLVFKDLPDELRVLMPLFCDCLMRLGTKGKSMEQLEDLIKLNTGGISFAYHSSTSPTDINTVEEGLSLGGHAFDGKTRSMYDLLQTILLSTDFDSQQSHKMIRQLLQSNASSAVDAVAESGHAYARRHAESGFSLHGRMVEQTAGITQVKLITSLASREDNGASMHKLAEQLKMIQSVALRSLKNDTRVALTCGSDVVQSNEDALQNFMTSMSQASITPLVEATSTEAEKSPMAQRTFFALPYQVSYTALALPTLPYTDRFSAPFAILAQLLTNRHLHHEIREKGGAYGGGAYARGLDGIFGMYSYRDPNTENTLRIMEDAGRWAAEKEWTDCEIEEAKLSVFQAIDAPQSVSQEGMTRFLCGVTQEMEQSRREWLLDVKKEQVREAAERVAEDVKSLAHTTILGKAFTHDTNKWAVEDLTVVAPILGEETISQPS